MSARRMLDPVHVKTCVGEQALFLKAVARERDAQDAKWGANVVGMLNMLAVLGEEVGECNRAVLERDWTELRRELVQVAAVCSKFYELLGANACPDEREVGR